MNRRAHMRIVICLLGWLFLFGQSVAGEILKNLELRQTNKDKPPAHWTYWGSGLAFDQSVRGNEVTEGMPLVVTVENEASKAAHIHQAVLIPENFRGRFVRFSIPIQSATSNGEAFLWAQVQDDRGRRITLADNSKASVSRKSDWAAVAVSIYVPHQGKTLDVGLGFKGMGQFSLGTINIDFPDASPNLEAQEAELQVAQVVQLIEEHGILKKDTQIAVAMQQLRQELNYGISQPALYAILKEILPLVGKGHSRLLTNEQIRSMGAKPQVQAATVVEPLHATQFGYVSVPPVFNTQAQRLQAFSIELARSIAIQNSEKKCGWVVDLRQNGGGNMWPMLEGLGAFFGNGPTGYFKNKEGLSSWSYKDGHVQLNEKFVFSSVGKGLVRPVAGPIAILIGTRTASSGEAVAISFKGMPNTHFFGAKTAGYATANHMYDLRGGAKMLLTTGEMLDRNKESYLDGILPDSTLQDIDVNKVPLPVQSWLSERCSLDSQK